MKSTIRQFARFLVGVGLLCGTLQLDLTGPVPLRGTMQATLAASAASTAEPAISSQAEADAHRVRFLLRHGASSFGIPTTFFIGKTHERSLAVGDFDDDGTADLAVAEAGTNTVWILSGDGMGGFGTPTLLAVESRQTMEALGDFNADGHADQAVADQFATGVTLRFGDGTGNFTATRDSSRHSTLISALLADFDQDGSPDLAMVDGIRNHVTVLLGDQQGEVRSTSSVAVSAAPTAIASGDFNGDDVADLVVANSASDRVSLLLGDGTGAFATVSDFPAGAAPTALVVLDVNRDGLTDLAVANGHSGDVSVLLGNGAGAFGAPSTIALGGTLSRNFRTAARRGEGATDNAATTIAEANTDLAEYEGIASLTLNPTTIAGGSGASSTGTVTLNAPAPAGGVVVTLASSNTELAASVPSITVPAGASSATFQVATNALYRRYSGLAFNATISASHGGVTRSAILNVTAQPRPTDVVLNPDSDHKGLNCAGETGILFDCKQGPNPGSQGTCTFRQECTLGCLTRPISGANWNDTCATTGPFPITLNPKRVVGGNPTAGTLLLTAPAVNGSTASVTSNSLAAGPANRQPQNIPTGATSMGFEVLTAQVNAIRFAFMDAHIRTIESGASVFTTRHARTWATVVPGTAPPLQMTSLSLDRSTTTGGLAVFGTVTLNQLAPAPQIRVVTVSLASSNPAAASVVQPNLTFTEGSSSASFTIETKAVAADTTVTISATLDGTTLTTSLTVTATPQATSVTSFFLDPLQVTGGSSSIGTVVLDGVAPSGGAVVTLQSANTTVARVPASVTVPAGSDRASFTVETSPVAANTTVSLSATYGTGSAFTSLTVLAAPAPVTMASLTLSPTSVVGGNTSTGTATLSAAAPSGGAVVSLSSSNAAVAAVPASVTVAAGNTSANFTVTTSTVSANTTATISGSFGGTTRSATLTVTTAPTGPLPAPTLLSPANDARFSPGQTITFDWTDVTGAASYTIQIDDGETFTAPLVVSQTVSVSQYTNNTLPMRRMWWRVRANDSAGNPGAWSAVRRFEVKN